MPDLSVRPRPAGRAGGGATAAGRFAVSPCPHSTVSPRLRYGVYDFDAACSAFLAALRRTAVASAARGFSAPGALSRVAAPRGVTDAVARGQTVARSARAAAGTAKSAVKSSVAAPPVEKSAKPLNVVFVSAEVAPWSKTGGLGDVVRATLPTDLGSLLTTTLPDSSLRLRPPLSRLATHPPRRWDRCPSSWRSADTP